MSIKSRTRTPGTPGSPSAKMSGADREPCSSERKVRACLRTRQHELPRPKRQQPPRITVLKLGLAMDKTGVRSDQNDV